MAGFVNAKIWDLTTGEIVKTEDFEKVRALMDSPLPFIVMASYEHEETGKISKRIYINDAAKKLVQDW